MVARGEGSAQQAAFEARRSGGELRLLAIRSPPSTEAIRYWIPVLADTKSGAIRLEAQSLEKKTIRWVARVAQSEVRFKSKEPLPNIA